MCGPLSLNFLKNSALSLREERSFIIVIASIAIHLLMNVDAWIALSKNATLSLIHRARSLEIRYNSLSSLSLSLSL